MTSTFGLMALDKAELRERRRARLKRLRAALRRDREKRELVQAKKADTALDMALSRKQEQPARKPDQYTDLDPNQMVDTAEFARIAGRSVQCVEAWRHHGELPFGIPPQPKWQYRLGDVLDFVAKNNKVKG